MSHFYGTLQGSRGQATRCGTKRSGITTHTASWDGAVQVAAYLDGHDRDCVRIFFTPWRGHGSEITLYEGPINPTAGDIIKSTGAIVTRLIETELKPAT